ncbi:MAG: hypothetical protein K0R57_3398 [Paenibacillaceae bacterium]|jgi:hypothetical protein|nr:hypothetical protein [Paenibacillaceae bacterium]
MRKQARWLAGAAAAVILGSGGMGWALAQGGKEILPVEPYLQDNGSIAAMPDVRGHWAQAAIELAISKDYVDGYEDGTFRPEQQVSRAEFTKLAVSALKLSAGTAKAGEAWYTPYMNAAVKAGIHQWSDFNSGDWNTPMTRGEMARMAVRAAGQSTDDDLKWMFLATKAGLIQGTDETGSLDVDGTTTRAQAVTIIERILSVKAGQKLEADLHAVSRAELLWHKTNVFTMLPQFFGYGNDGTSVGLVRWDPNNLVLETPDGNWKGELLSLKVIDLEDPNDPFRSELPPLEEMTFAAGIKDGASFRAPVSTARHSYILWPEAVVYYNNDPQMYNNTVLGYLGVSINGIKQVSREERIPGTVNGTSSLHYNGKPTNAVILNKESTFPKYVGLSVGTMGPRLVNHKIYEALNQLLDLDGGD